MKPAYPLDIFQRTPKTNCGECGYPSCLAFGAAVAKTGADPHKCPSIDLTGLVLEETLGTDSEGLARERDLALVEHLKGKVAGLDFSAIADKLGAAWQVERPDSLVFPFLGRQVVLAKDSVLIDQIEPDDPRDAILLYNYVFSAGGRKPDGEWIGMESMPNSISKVRTLATYCEDRLAELFAGKTKADSLSLAERVGGKEGPGSSAFFEVIIPVLPMIPLYVLFWGAEPEDGFPAKVKVLFDHHVLDFLDLESLVFTAERMADRLLALGG
ncbi:MAG: DUF3786 domain-containing protein [Proteobacteria bacterium]|nr:DUF3786 domain-containing protein [Pseudomonadota bacterium]